MVFRKNIHVAALGFDIERIVAPAVEGNANIIYIISRENEDKAAKHLDAIQKQLSAKNITVLCDNANHNDLFKLLKKYREIIEKEKKNSIYINVSSGTKITAIAGMMACMMFKDVPFSIEPYYAKMKEYTSEKEWLKGRKGKELFQECTGYEGSEPLDKYVIQVPKKELVDVLAVLRNSNWKMKKKDLLAQLLKNKIILKDDDTPNNGRKGTHHTPKEYMSLRQKILEPLKSRWEAVTVGDGKGGYIEVTQKGKNILQFMEGFG